MESGSSGRDGNLADDDDDKLLCLYIRSIAVRKYIDSLFFSGKMIFLWVYLKTRNIIINLVRDLYDIAET